MKKPLLLIGFSCTGKTSLAKEAFKGAEIVDSDDEILKYIKEAGYEHYSHIYEIYMGYGRERAMKMIEEAEGSLCAKWADDTVAQVISLGPGFPLRENWWRLRAVSYVVLFQRSPEGIYDGFVRRRDEIFAECPKARQHDNWDVGVMVDKGRREHTRDEAIANIKCILCERESYYSNCDEKLCTDDKEAAVNKLQDIEAKLDGVVGNGA